MSAPGSGQRVVELVRGRPGGTIDIGEQVDVVRRAGDETMGDPRKPTAQREPYRVVATPSATRATSR
jgi:hypothetical protein